MLAAAFAGVLGGCKDGADVATGDYGYVQFRLYKSGSYDDFAATRGGVGILNNLYDAAKIQLTLHPLAGSGGSDIIQTVPLEAQNKELAEYGMQS
jgi:hypothetical protein